MVMSMTIKDIRTATGLSQARFAERFHIPTRTIENWESGIRKPPVYVIYLLALAAGITAE